MKTSFIKSFVFLLIVSATIHNTYSQNSKKEIDTLKENKSKLAREFAKVATGNSFSSIGNFASIGTDQQTLKASFFFLLDNSDILNIEASGGATEGVAAIFKEGKLNSNVGLGFSYNLMLRNIKNNKSIVVFDTTEENEIDLAIERERKAFQKKQMELLANLNELNFKKDLENAQKTIDKLNENLILLKSDLKTITIGPYNDKDIKNQMTKIKSLDVKKFKSDSTLHKIEEIKYDSIIYQSILIKEKKKNENINEDIFFAKRNLKIMQRGYYKSEEINQFEKKMELIEDKITDAENLREELKNRKYTKEEDYTDLLYTYRELSLRKIDVLKKKKDDLKPIASSFSWISLGYKVTNDSFLLFDESLPITDQLARQSYSTQSIFLSYNHQSDANAKRDKEGEIIDASFKNKEFLSIGGRLDVTNNLSDLEKVEITDTNQIGTSGQREKTTKQNAFSGNYQDGLTNGSIYLDYYNFLSNGNSYALHFNPKIVMRENFKPVTSVKLGVLFPFKDKKKDGNTIYLEIFYRINDLFNTTNSDNSILNRNIMGISGTFPFQF